MLLLNACLFLLTDIDVFVMCSSLSLSALVMLAYELFSFVSSCNEIELLSLLVNFYS